MSDPRTRAPFGRAGQFHQRLRFGSHAERLVARWALSRGWPPLPLAQLPRSGSGGPALVTPDGPVIAPDLGLVLPDGRLGFIEVKRRTRPSLHHASGTLMTGIELLDLERYLDLADALPVPLVIAFVHDEHVRALLGGNVRVLVERIHHEACGLAFWRLHDLDVLADAEEMDDVRALFKDEDRTVLPRRRL